MTGGAKWASCGNPKDEDKEQPNGKCTSSLPPSTNNLRWSMLIWEQPNGQGQGQPPPHYTLKEVMVRAPT
jgi:hypothetical protein